MQQVHVASARETDWPVPHRWDFSVQQSDPFIYFGDDFRTKKLSVFLFFNILRGSSKHSGRWYAVASPQILFYQLFKFIFMFVLIREIKSSPSKSTVIFEGLDVLFPIVYWNAVILICFKYFKLILVSNNHGYMIELTMSNELLEIGDTVFRRYQQQVTCFCFFDKLFLQSKILLLVNW